MLKKKTTKKAEVKAEVKEEVKVCKPKLEECTLTFGSEDLNKLVEYINKLTKEINKCQ